MATISLSNGVDNSAGATAGNDSFEGTGGQVSAGDVLDAGGGTDTLLIQPGGATR